MCHRHLTEGANSVIFAHLTLLFCAVGKIKGGRRGALARASAAQARNGRRWITTRYPREASGELRRGSPENGALFPDVARSGMYACPWACPSRSRGTSLSKYATIPRSFSCQLPTCHHHLTVSHKQCQRNPEIKPLLLQNKTGILRST
jgi:hypothetical protein